MLLTEQTAPHKIIPLAHCALLYMFFLPNLCSSCMSVNKSMIMLYLSWWRDNPQYIFVPRLTKWGRGAIEFGTVCPSVHLSVCPLILSARYQTSEHGHSLYHAPGVASFAKNTIILSRRGTLELRVHWFISYVSGRGYKIGPVCVYVCVDLLSLPCAPLVRYLRVLCTSPCIVSSTPWCTRTCKFFTKGWTKCVNMVCIITPAVTPPRPHI